MNDMSQPLSPQPDDANANTDDAAHADPNPRAAPEESSALFRQLMIDQAHQLDAMFTELVEEAVENKPDFEFTEAYARLALRAQTNCRASLEAIVRSDRSRALAQRLDAMTARDNTDRPAHAGRPPLSE